ncbi:MAG: Lrp/AsnC family transcriptional regulator [Methanomassiliicoccales archaeon]
MDRIDIEILKLLRENSRESLGKMAGSLGVSKATVSRRISRLEEEGVITGYTVITNLAKMGVMRAVLIMDLTGASVNRVIDEMRKFDEIEHAYKLFGDHSVFCEVYVRSVDELYQLIQEHIMNVPGIQNVEVDILIERIDLNLDAEFKVMSRVGSG